MSARDARTARSACPCRLVALRHPAPSSHSLIPGRIPTELSAGLSGDLLIEGHFVVLRRLRRPAALARLNLPPLQILAQRRFQPVLPGVAFAASCLVDLVRHHGP